MKITREIAQLDWVEFGKKTGVCFCKNCGYISPFGWEHKICPNCGLLGQFIKGESNG